MARTESTFSERIGARISPELKAQLQALTESGQFESEADAVREALWAFVEQQPTTAAPPAPPIPDRLEWLMSVTVVLIALVGSRIMNALGQEKVKPAELVDEAIQETIYNHTILWQKLRAGQQTHQRQIEDSAKG